MTLKITGYMFTHNCIFYEDLHGLKYANHGSICTDKFGKGTGLSWGVGSSGDDVKAYQKVLSTHPEVLPNIVIGVFTHCHTLILENINYFVKLSRYWEKCVYTMDILTIILFDLLVLN